MGNRISGLILLACLIAEATVAHAGEKLTTRNYPIPNHGAIELTIPESWKDEVRRPPQNLPPTIVLRPSNGDDFQILVTPLWNINGLSTYSNSLDTLRYHANSYKKHLEPIAEEKEIELQLIDGATGQGYYISVTDKAPKPGEYKFMIQAVVGVGDLFLTATVLYRQRGAEVISQGLTMLGNAVQPPLSEPSTHAMTVAAYTSTLVQDIERAATSEGAEMDSLTKSIFDRVYLDTSGVAAAILPKLTLSRQSEKAVALYVWVMGLAEAPQSIDSICKIMQEAKSEMLLNACRQSLSRIGGEQSGECLVSALKRVSDREERFSIFNSLGEVQYAGALPLALEVLRNDREKQYWRPIFVFGKMGDIAIPYLIEKIGDDDDNVRWNAMNVLGQWLITPESSEPLRIQFWKENDPIIRNLILSSVELTTVDIDTAEAFMKKVVNESKDTGSVRFAKESIELYKTLPDSVKSVATNKRPVGFLAVYSRLWESYGNGTEDDYVLLKERSTFEDEPALKKLRERILRRDSDEAFYDFKKVNVIIYWNRLISSSANRNR